MRILKDFKIPDFKFPKFKMKELSEIDEVKVDYEAVKKAEENKKKKENKNYEGTHFETIKQSFINSLEKYPENTFMLEKFNPKGEWTKIKYEQFCNEVIGFGTALTRKLGLKDTRVVIIGENTYHWYVSYMTMLCGAGIAVPVDKELPENEIENVIKRSKASAVIFSTKKSEVIKRVSEKLPDVKYFIQMNSDSELANRFVGMQYLIDEGKLLVKNGDNSFMDIQVDPDEFKVLLFTSGTTSNAKGVMLCNRNLAENINAASAYVDLRSDDRLMSILPLHHTYESSIGFLYPFAMGSSISICQGLKYIVPDLKETNPTALLTVPLLVENLYKKINANIKKSKKDGLVNSMIHVTNALKNVGVDIKRKVFAEIYENLGGKIRIIVSAAAPIDAKIGKWLEDIGITFLQGYGLTETAPIAALTPDFQTKVGSAGKAVVCAELKIDNPNENGEGEVLIKSRTLMLGYYEDEEATHDAIIEENGERWFHSGDIGYLDNEGFLYITGRSKNVIVTQNGKNIYPQELEFVINKLPYVEESMVYARNKSKTDTVLGAKIVYNKDEIIAKFRKQKDYKELVWEDIKEMNKELPDYKHIKEISLTDEPLEKTTTQKVKRFVEMKKIETSK